MSRFQTTRWSLIAAATHAAPMHARSALEQLCCAYRPPVLAYIRRAGHSSNDAEDLAQAFFVRFLERGWYTTADPQRGRFRALLLTSLRHFLADAHAHDVAIKRGGGMLADDADVDQLYDSAAETPEAAFDRAWLGTVLARAMHRLQTEWGRAGKQAQFDQLAPLLTEGVEASELRAMAEASGLRSNTVAVQAHRMRHRLRQLVRLELLQTVASREALEQELAELRSFLPGHSP
ncbi:MAG TPA: sigma factor [Thermomonas sp.]|nr:sigma factor [Thermomonas sp.]